MHKIKSGVYRFEFSDPPREPIEVTFVLEKEGGHPQVIVYRAGNTVRNVPLELWLEQDL